MSEIIAQHMHLIDNAKKACEKVGLTPQCLPIRGGTDGCQLSFRDFLARILEQVVMHIMDLMSISQLKVWKSR